MCDYEPVFSSMKLLIHDQFSLKVFIPCSFLAELMRVNESSILLFVFEILHLFSITFACPGVVQSVEDDVGYKGPLELIALDC